MEIAEKMVGHYSVSKAGTFRLDSEPKYYMSQTKYKYIPMTNLQFSLVNSAIGKRQSPDKFLSQRQLQILSSIKSNPELMWKDHIKNDDFISAWNSTIGLLDTKISKK